MKKFIAQCLAWLLLTTPAFAAYPGPTPYSVVAGGTGLATLTAHAVIVGAGTANVVLVGPGATAGVPLVSGGSSADPSFTTAVVAGGGTGLATLTAHNLIVGEGTSNVAFVAPAVDSVVAWAGSTSADPTATSIGSCSTGSSALTYNTSTHAFGCNSITAGAAPSVAIAATSASITLASTNLLTTVVNNTTVATATLPSAVTVGTGFRECLKDGTEDFNAHNVTLKSTAGTIDGVAAGTGIVMNLTHQELCAISDGTNWYVE